jgi:ribosomal protein S18 acetylase RimI-like enzyme
MSVQIVPVASRRDLKRFVKYPMDLYRGNLYFVPQLIRDEMELLTPAKNPAFENAEAQAFLAMRDGKIVGRIAAILSHAANRKYGTRNLRFSWFDTIDDLEVTRALFVAVEAWGRERGMETLTGPHAFTDLDPEGMLIEGFEELGTIATIYNHPYYPRLAEQCGFVKDVDYLEFQAQPPAGATLPEKTVRLAEWAQKRNNFRIVKYTSVRKAKKERAAELFDVLDEAFEDLYGTVPLSRTQKEYFVNKYMSLVNPDFLEIAVNEKDEMIGFIISMPSLSRAFQKAKGRLFPFGFLHILRALKKFDTLDFYLAGVKKEYRGKGVDLIMTMDIFRTAMAKGIRRAESNVELETNTKIQNEWKIVPVRQHRRRRIFRKAIA